MKEEDTEKRGLKKVAESVLWVSVGVVQETIETILGIIVDDKAKSFMKDSIDSD
jgi:hypothetical protein